MNRNVIVVGASGQDGLILSEVLSQRGYDVVGVASHRHSDGRLAESFPAVRWLYSDRSGNLPDEQFPPKAEVVIHLAGQSSVAKSWEEPSKSVLGNVVQSFQLFDYCAKTRTPVVFAGSSEMFPRGSYSVDETTMLDPSSPYGVGKAAALQYLRIMRLQGNLQSSSLIMFNHESPLRAPGFVSSLVTSQICGIVQGINDEVRVGSLASKKDFNWAPDFVRVMANEQLWEIGDDFVLASGEATSIEELAINALKEHKIDPNKIQEIQDYLRPFDFHPTGDATKARDLLGFTSTIPSGEIVARMVRMHLDFPDLTDEERRVQLVRRLAQEVMEP